MCACVGRSRGPDLPNRKAADHVRRAPGAASGTIGSGERVRGKRRREKGEASTACTGPLAARSAARCSRRDDQ